MSARNKLDQYYTNPLLADRLSLDVVMRYGSEHTYVEPSAGEGNFLGWLPDFEAYDLEPKHSEVKQQDFFTVEGLEDKVVIGNPPYGKNSSLAIKFFNHAAKQKVRAICFIVPKTFLKESVVDRLHRNYELVISETLPYNSFILDGKDWDVPSVWQIWEYRQEKRPLFGEYHSGLFDIVKPSHEDATLWVRRVGARAGQLISKQEATPSTSYGVVPLVGGVEELIEKALPILKEIRDNTAGVRSISKSELHRAVKQGETE